MKMLVLVKQVPDTATQVKVGSDPRTIDQTGITWIVSPYDEFALEKFEDAAQRGLLTIVYQTPSVTIYRYDRAPA